MTIVDRLARNLRKQKEFRHIVRGLDHPVERKRMADVYFLHHYAGWTYAKLARHYGVSSERVRQIANKRALRFNFTICHPKRSCMP